MSICRYSNTLKPYWSCSHDNRGHDPSYSSAKLIPSSVHFRLFKTTVTHAPRERRSAAALIALSALRSTALLIARRPTSSSTVHGPMCWVVGTHRFHHAHLCPDADVAWFWRGTLLGVAHVARTSSVAFPFVLERLSNTPARLPEASQRTPDLSRTSATGR